jgi:hypothetical protein
VTVGTMSAKLHKRAWNARALAFLLMALLIAGATAALRTTIMSTKTITIGEGDAGVAAVIRNGPVEPRA